METHPALAVVHDQHLARGEPGIRDAEGVEDRRAARGGGAHSTADSPAWTSSSTTATTDSTVASSSLSPSSGSSGQPVTSAYGATVCTQRALLEVTTR